MSNDRALMAKRRKRLERERRQAFVDWIFSDSLEDPPPLPRCSCADRVLSALGQCTVPGSRGAWSHELTVNLPPDSTDE